MDTVRALSGLARKNGVALGVMLRLPQTFPTQYALTLHYHLSLHYKTVGHCKIRDENSNLEAGTTVARH